MLVILQATNSCNLRCVYCSVCAGDTPRQDLTAEDCRLLVQNLPSVVSQDKCIRFLWHGGEPTLLPPERFEEMIKILKTLEESEYRVSFAMQSNGFYFSDACINLLKKYDVHIGISIDGPENLHNASRKTSGGIGSYHQVKENIKRLLEKNISVALLSVWTPHHLNHEEEYIDWLEEMDMSVRINPLLALGREEFGITPADYYSSLKKLFILLAEREISCHVQPLTGILESLLYNHPISDCSYNGIACGKSIFSLGPHAELYLCNRMSLHFGSLYDKSLSEWMNSPLWQFAQNRQHRLESRCSSCSVHRFCNGGCTAVYADSPTEDFCAAIKDFYSFIFGKGLTLLKKILVAHKLKVKQELAVLNKAKAGISTHV